MKGLFPVICAFSCLIAAQSFAGSATWNSDPVDNLWRDTFNWTPAAVPNGESDTATFGTSNRTTVKITRYSPGTDGLLTTLDQLVFEEDASAYTVKVVPTGFYGVDLSIVGGGVINNSGRNQNIVVSASGTSVRSAGLLVSNNAMIGDQIVITNQGGASADGDATYGAVTELGWDFGSALNVGKATFINEGSTASGTTYGGFTNIEDYCSAESATFINQPGTVSGAAAGHTLVQVSAPGNLGSSTFINNAATVPGAEGGWTEVDGGFWAGASFFARGAATANAQGGQVYAFGGDGNAKYLAGGGTSMSAQGGLIDVGYVTSSAQTIVTAKAGSDGGMGGTIMVEGTANIGIPQFQVFGNGLLDLTNVSEETMAIGSLAGDGLVNLAGHDLSVGGNNLSTIFAGIISGTGNLTKEGTGAFALNGTNTYTGGTTVSAGTLGGSGTIPGKVIVAASAVLAPAASGKKAATLTINKTLTFQTGSSYACLFAGKGHNAKSDQISAKGVTIFDSAQFVVTDQVTGILSTGATFIVINNLASTPISGTFSNLPDSGNIAVGPNTLQANYEGGDGNDLTLTVVQ